MIPNKVFQALACATPLVTADTPAARELLVDGESALLVPPGDAQALADALRRLASDDALRARIAAGGLAAYRRHASEDVLGRRWLSILERARLSRALAPRRSRPSRPGSERSPFSATARFTTGRFDLGNMTQAVWSTAHGDPLAVTNLAGEQTTRLASHFDPILVLFAPLWLVWPSPELLLVTQAIAIALGALPVFWLARKHLEQRARGTRLRARVPALPGDAVARALGVPPRRARVPVAAVRVLVPRRGPPRSVRDLRGARVHDEGGGRPGRRRARPLVRPRAKTARRGDRDRDRGGRGRGGRARRRRALQRRRRPVRRTVRRGRRLADRDPEDARHRPADDRARGLRPATASTYLLALLVPLAFLPLAAPLALLPALPDLALNLLSSTETQTSIHFHYVAPLVPALFAAADLRGRALRAADRDAARCARPRRRTSCSARSRSGARSRAAKTSRRTPR